LAGRFAHLPVRTRLAMVMYLRPESWAAATASVSGHSSLTLASFTSIGRLMPARTSTFGRPMTEMARLEGVPPNMSVRMATPSPVIQALDRRDDVLAALFDVIVRADGHCFDLLLRADHMLEGRAELGGKAPVRDEYEADHRVPRRHVWVAPHERAPIITILSPCARAFPTVWGWVALR